MADDTRGDRFVELSRLLLEIDELSPVSAAAYLGMLDDLDPSWPLDDMAAHLLPLRVLPPTEREQRIIAALRAEPAWKTATVNVLQVWYSGSLTRANGELIAQPPEAWLGALVWPLLDTQAPGLPGPFFGEWAYPPTRVGSPVPASGPTGRETGTETSDDTAGEEAR